jgi:hypothetical protein
MIVLYIIAAIIFAYLLFSLVLYAKYDFPLRPKENGFTYVYIEDDGSVRELIEDEKNYLSKKVSSQ